MFDSSLHYPDKPEWQLEPAYQDSVAILLTDIFDDLKRSQREVIAYHHALQKAERCLSLSMSSRQRMLVKWAQSMGYLGLMEWREGSDCLDDALELAERLDDVPACAELASMNGGACAADLNYESAREYNNYALVLLQGLRRSDQSLDPEFEARIQLHLASSEFTLERYVEARSHLGQARTLIELPLTHPIQEPSRSRQLADLYWIDAILHRWIGTPETALHLALKAYDLYSHLSSPHLLSQFATISSVTAEIALDLADRVSADLTSYARTTYLDVARPFVDSAMKTADLARDELTAGLALLAEVRYQIARGELVDFEALVMAVLKTANDRHNPAIAIQAYTTLGRAFVTYQQPGAAEHCFQQADTLAHAAGLPSMSVWARRALLWERELH